jgi:hypothetical protein
MSKRFDNIYLGFVLGVLVPITTLAIVYVHTFHNYSVKEFFYYIKTMNIMTKLFSLCVIPNLGLFFLFIWPNYLKSARGVLTATFLVAFFVVIVQIINGTLF